MANPINIAYSRLVFTGALPGSEKWATGLTILRPQGSAATAVAAMAADSTVVNIALAVKAINAAGWTCAAVTLYDYAAGATGADDVATATLGTTGASGGPHPNQTALVTTIRSALGTGRGRGRAFWPATGITMAGAGLADTASAQSLAQAVAAFLTKYKGVVVSHAAGNTQAVTSVTVDNRTDVIRARAERLTAQRYSYPVTV